MRVPIILVCLCLAGCAGSQSYLRVLESSGALRVDPGATPDERIVTMRNTKDFGFDPDDKDTRTSTAVQYACSAAGGRVVSEQSIATGEYLLGNPARTYTMRVRCA